MANITAQTVKDLRERTGVGMMECKKALEETGGDIEKAIEELRKKGLAKAAKKAGRVASEGVIALATEGNKATLVELNTETDFAAKSEGFQALAKKVSVKALEVFSSLEDVLDAPLSAGKSVKESINEAVAVIGENLNLRRVANLELTGNGVIASYVHNVIADGMGKIGAVVALESNGDKKQLEQFGKQLAMHITAAKPDALNIEAVDAGKVAKEREIFKEQSLASGKPENIVDKMVEGRIRKYYEEVVFLEQVFVIDGKITVKEAIANASKEIGSPIKVTGYKYLVLGEGVEKKEEDFAAEVAKVAGN